MKTSNKEIANDQDTINLNNEQLEQQMVQQRYHSELEKYQEQISRTQKLGTNDGQAA